jgi:transcriptional regulator with XRE-family HTH domain
MSFGRNLQRLREQAGLSQSELAKKANVSVKTLQNWEIDRNQPRFDAIVKLAQVLGVSIESFVAGMGPPAKKPRNRRKKP